MNKIPKPIIWKYAKTLQGYVLNHGLSDRAKVLSFFQYGTLGEKMAFRDYVWIIEHWIEPLRINF